MSTQVVSFRASGEFLTWLQSQVQEGESLNQAASRLLKQLMNGSQQPLYTSTSTVLPESSTPSTKSPGNVYSVDASSIPGLENLIASVVEERTQAITQMIAERMEAIEQRLGEYERLKAKADEDALRPAPMEDYQQVLVERDSLRAEIELLRQLGTTDAVVERNSRIQELEKRNHELRVKFNEARTKANQEIATLTQQRDSYRRQAENLREQRDELDRRNDKLKDEMNQYKQSTAAGESVQNHPPLQEIRDLVLRDLKLGKQAPGYKAAVKALDRFVDQLGKSAWQSSSTPETLTTECDRSPGTA